MPKSIEKHALLNVDCGKEKPNAPFPSPMFLEIRDNLISRIGGKRAAALEALAERADPSLLPEIASHTLDKKWNFAFARPLALSGSASRDHDGRPD